MQSIELPRPRKAEWQPFAADGAFRNDGQGFMRGIVNHRQAFDDPAFGRPVKHESHRPDVVGLRWPQQGLLVADRHLLAFAPSYLQACLRVAPLHPFVIDTPALLPKLQADHAVAVALMPMRQADDLATQFDIAIRSPTETERTGADSGNPQ